MKSFSKFFLLTSLTKHKFNNMMEDARQKKINHERKSLNKKNTSRKQEFVTVHGDFRVATQFRVVISAKALFLLRTFFACSLMEEFEILLFFCAWFAFFLTEFWLI